MLPADKRSVPDSLYTSKTVVLPLVSYRRLTSTCRAVRQVAETYAFLPREAVTRFLMSCTDCQKRMHLSRDRVADGGASSDYGTNDSGPGGAGGGDYPSTVNEVDYRRHELADQYDDGDAVSERVCTRVYAYVRVCVCVR